MDKPYVQSRDAVHERPAGERIDGVATREAILRATRERLTEVGYANLNLRDIARAAGVNHALIGYHFGGKQQLVLTVLDEVNRQLLNRQEHMYHGTVTPSQQWQQACDFYEQDLKSGFVRLLMELMGASFHDLELRAGFVPRLLAWTGLIEEAAGEFIQKAGLDLAISPQAISAWIGWFWIGMEASMMLGIDEKNGHQREALNAMTQLLKRVEARAASGTAQAGTPRRTAARKPAAGKRRRT